MLGCILDVDISALVGGQGGEFLHMEYEDKMLECSDPAHDENTSGADKQFSFSADEQAFFAEKGFSEPQRCPACRAAKKARFNRSGDRQMHAVVCANCGREDQVPFVPKGDRPVYCSDCFAQQ